MATLLQYLDPVWMLNNTSSEEANEWLDAVRSMLNHRSGELSDIGLDEFYTKAERQFYYDCVDQIRNDVRLSGMQLVRLFMMASRVAAHVAQRIKGMDQ